MFAFIARKIEKKNCRKFCCFNMRFMCWHQNIYFILFPTKFYGLCSYSRIVYVYTHDVTIKRTNGNAWKRNETRKNVNGSVSVVYVFVRMRLRASNKSVERLKKTKLRENFCWRQIKYFHFCYCSVDWIWWHGSFNLVNIQRKKGQKCRVAIYFYFKYFEWCHYFSTFWSQFTSIK